MGADIIQCINCFSVYLRCCSYLFGGFVGIGGDFTRDARNTAFRIAVKRVDRIKDGICSGGYLCCYCLYSRNAVLGGRCQSTRLRKKLLKIRNRLFGVCNHCICTVKCCAYQRNRALESGKIVDNVAYG